MKPGKEGKKASVKKVTESKIERERKSKMERETTRARAERKFQARHRDTRDVMVKMSDRCGIY